MNYELLKQMKEWDAAQMRVWQQAKNAKIRIESCGNAETAQYWIMDSIMAACNQIESAIYALENIKEI